MDPTEITEYVRHADSRKDGDRIARQFHDAATTRKDIPCRCGGRFTVAQMYRCYACGEWFCKKCAPGHFSIDLAEWREDKKTRDRSFDETYKLSGYVLSEREEHIARLFFNAN